MNPIENFAKGTLASGIASGATSMSLGSGEGARFPQPSTDGIFYGVIWNWTDYADPSDDPDREIVKVTARSTDTLTIVRAQQSTSDNNHNTAGKTYKFIAGITKTDYEELRNKIDVSPTEEKSSTASKGGVFNGGFELSPAFTAVQTSANWIDGTAAGSASVDKYGWYGFWSGATGSIRFDEEVSYKGKKSIKIVVSAATADQVIDVANWTEVGGLGNNRYGIRVKPNTKYRLSWKMKTSAISSGNSKGAQMLYWEYDSSNTGSQLDLYQQSYVTGTNDWTHYQNEFTSNASAAYAYIILRLRGETGTVWFDDIKLEEIVEDTSFAGKIASRIKALFQAVTSTDSIDQNLDPTGAYADTYALTNAVNEGATHKQTFTPTKKHITQIGVWPVHKGSGDWTVFVHDSTNAVMARMKISNSTITNGAFNYFDVPFLRTSGDYHFHVISSVADGTLKSNTNNDLEDGSFIQRYAKNTEAFKLIVNGIKTDLKSDSDGVINGSIIDLDNGKYLKEFSVTPTEEDANCVYSAQQGGITTEEASYSVMVNGYAANPNGFQSASNSTERSITWKINTILPIRHLKLKFSEYDGSSNDKLFQISKDGINWKNMHVFNENTSTVRTISKDTDFANGLNVFFLRGYIASGTSEVVTFRLDRIEADIDTSKIPQGLLYPIGEENRFTETVKMPSDVTRIYYRENKFDNGNGVLMPALELTDASANYIGHIPLRLDNSLETNPCVSIITGETTNGQQSGTGSADGSIGYILNDGEYMTLSSATDELKIVYKVGGGTTTFSDITRNLILMSSDGDGDDSTKDPSHQQTVIIGTEEAGLLQIVRGMEEEIQSMKPGQDEEWKEWDPELTWTGGTPASITTVARYKIVGKICFFNIDISSADSNACSDLTIGLPAEAKSEGAQAAIVAHQLYGAGGATWAAIQGFIDDAGTSIEFRDFNTATDNQNVRVIATGFFEIS